MACSVPLVLYVVVQCVALLCVLAGTPLEMFRLKVPRGDPICITLWGSPDKCGSSNYLLYSETLWSTCPSRLTLFRVAQAFALISVLVYGAAFVAGLTLLFCCSSLRLVCLALNAVGVVTLCVVWAAMTVTYNKPPDPSCFGLKDGSTFGAGFFLLVVAWILDILNIIFLLLPSRTMESDDSTNSKEYIEQE